jgi:protein-disulfide isomerase-like protein with CxxC motif
MKPALDRTDLQHYERAIGQLRHAYALMTNDATAWAPVQRQRFAEGLVGPQIEALEDLLRDFATQQDDLAAAFTANAKHRRQYREAEQELLAHVHEIASASQARRIITMVFHRIAEKP